MILFSIHLLLTLALLSPLVYASGESLQTISAIDGFGQQRPCATSCFYNEVGDDLLGSNMRCCKAYGSPTCKGGVADQCYCREDLRPTAVDWLSRCVETRCATNQVDFSSALAVYDGYCSRVNKEVAVPQATSTPTTTGSSGNDGGSLLAPTVSVTQTFSTVKTQMATSGACSLGGAARRVSIRIRRYRV